MSVLGGLAADALRNKGVDQLVSLSYPSWIMGILLIIHEIKGSHGRLNRFANFPGDSIHSPGNIHNPQSITFAITIDVT